MLGGKAGNAFDAGEEINFIAHIAAQKGDAKLMEHLLRAGISPDISSPDGTSILTRTAVSRHFEIAELLVKEGADVNTKSNDGLTPLFAAILSKRSDLVELLIDSGADSNAARLHGLTPLGLAIVLGQKDVVTKLVFSGANAELKSLKSFTPLQLAVASKQTSIAEFLSKFKRQKTSAGKTEPSLRALAYAIKKADEQQVRLQLQAGINPNERIEDIWTPLMLAATGDAPEIVEILLNAGSDVNAKTRSGYTPLHIAALKGNSRSAERLVAAGANPSSSTAGKITPVDMAREAGHHAIAASLMNRTPKKRSLARKNFVGQVQSLLYLRGYKVGAIDGYAGKKTEKAIKQFQWGLHGLADGKIDEEVYVELWERYNKAGPIGNNWGGVVLDRKSRSIHGKFRQDSSQAALSGAKKNCRKKRAGCETYRTFKNKCVAMARRGKGWAFRIEDTIWKARNAALKGCKKANPKGCRLTWEFCSDGSFSN